MQDLSDVHSALISRGFRDSLPWEHGVYKYIGDLETDEGPIEVELILRDFDKPPKIRILNVPDKLMPIAPHIGPDGDLCYLAWGSVALDIFNPASQVLACVEEASEVLNKILKGEMINDLADEFFANWRSQYYDIYLDTADTISKYVSMQVVKHQITGHLSIVLTDDTDRSAKKLNSFGFKLEDMNSGACIIETKIEPLPWTNGRNWPPKDLNEFIEWQYALDPKSATTIIKRIKTLYKDAVCKMVVILIASPTIKYAAAFVLPDLKVKLQSVKQAKSVLGNCKLLVMDAMRLDDKYVVERNQPNRNSLLHKKVALIGAGAIGGYLADLLVRSGAGLGEGKLIIIDKDSFQPGNIGRHKLGFESLLSYKAEALAKQILVSFPTANVKGIVDDVRNLLLEDFDLIINATGEEPLGDGLSYELNNGKFVPFISVWIEGPGTVVRSILQPSKEHACFRCLKDKDRSPLYKAVNEEYKIGLAGHGCESLYVEFPATAAVYAAALGASHVLDWINGEKGPLLRTIVIDRNFTKLTIDQDPTKQPDCPACNTTKTG